MFLCKGCLPSSNTNLKIGSVENNSDNSVFGVKLHLDNHEKNKFYKVIEDDEDDQILEKYNNLSTIDKLLVPTGAAIEYRSIPKITKKAIPTDKIIHKQLTKCENKSNLSNKALNNYTLIDLLSVSGNLSSDNNERKRTKKDLIIQKKETIKKQDNCNIQNNSLISLFSKINDEKHDDYSPNKRKNNFYSKCKTKKKKKEKNNVENPDNLKNFELYHTIETMKNFEQFQQIKDLENFQNILELQQMQKLINGKNSININQIPINQPPQNYQYSQFMPQFQYYPIQLVEPQKENKVTENNINYCTFCEEIYKYVILNNISLKKIKCQYCNNTLNLSSLEFFLEKYKGELQNKIRNQIKAQYISKIVANNDSLSLSSMNESKDKKEILNNNASNSNLNNNNINMKNISESDIPLSQNHQISKDNLGSFASNIPDNNLTEYENINNNLFIKDNKNNSHEPSLTEAFKTKRADLFRKILQRSKKQKKQLDNSQNSKSNNKSKQNNTQEEKELINIQETSKLIEKVNIRNPKKRIKEPSKELLDRLQNGKRAKMTKKEIKEINERLYKHLVDIKVPDKNENKKEELENRNQKKKQFTDMLKEKVIINYKSNLSKKY